MDAQKLTEEFKWPLTPEKTLPEQNHPKNRWTAKSHSVRGESPLLHRVGHGAGWSLKNRTTLNQKKLKGRRTPRTIGNQNKRIL